MEKNNLIFTLSGIRGIVGKELNFEIVKKIGIAYGSWLKSIGDEVIIGKDTRPSSKVIEKAILEGLGAIGIKIINVGECPTPIIIHAKNRLNIPGGIIITGSHNPQEWNGLKLLSLKTFLEDIDLAIISRNLRGIKLENYSYKKLKSYKNENPLPAYIKDLYNHIDYQSVKKKNKLKVVIDTGAGAGKYATPQILRGLGCKVKLVNNEFLIHNNFPREIEPIENNLKELIMEVWQSKSDIGFAHDSDADRLAIIGENGVCYPEDISLALIAEDYLKNHQFKNSEIFFVTNLASSLMFELIAEKYRAKIIRTPIGERFLVEEMNRLINKGQKKAKNQLILGGEGSCGGVMIPDFNNTRDGIFAAAKIVEILVKTGKSVSYLVSELPIFYSYREKINIKNKNAGVIIEKVKKELINEGEKVIQIKNDLRFGEEKEWFVLIHPSNTEPIIRIISEARRKSLARIYCETTAALVELIISN